MSTYLVGEINSKRLIENIKNIKKQLNVNTKFCAVVKSNAYGHGIVEISNLIYMYVDYFAVSFIEEAIKLRIAGIDKPILLLIPFNKNDIINLIDYNIIIPINSIIDLKNVNYYSKKIGKRANVSFIINTGMNRLGMDSKKEICDCLNYLKNHENLNLISVFSHFSDITNSIFTKRQFNLFLRMTAEIKKYKEDTILHIAASGGFLKNKLYHLDMVRIGILMYGYLPYQTQKIEVKPVMKIKAKIIQIRKNIKNKHLLYGKYRSVENDVNIIRLGYADGFLRKGIENSLNNLCMDLCAIKQEDKNTKDVVIMENALSLSKKYDTIPYEILTSVTRRAIIKVK